MAKTFDALQVELGERSYEIIVGEKILDEAGSFIKKKVRGNRVWAIIKDE
jgi:predicted RNA binding protein with dsRBD fold (UPF0201 family)